MHSTSRCRRSSLLGWGACCKAIGGRGASRSPSPSCDSRKAAGDRCSSPHGDRHRARHRHYRRTPPPPPPPSPPHLPPPPPPVTSFRPPPRGKTDPHRLGLRRQNVLRVGPSPPQFLDRHLAICCFAVRLGLAAPLGLREPLRGPQANLAAMITPPPPPPPCRHSSGQTPSPAVLCAHTKRDVTSFKIQDM